MVFHVKCPDCGEKMFYANGIWRCPCCSIKIGDESYKIIDDMPVSCAVCGGAWPKCEDRCPVHTG